MELNQSTLNEVDLNGPSVLVPGWAICAQEAAEELWQICAGPAWEESFSLQDYFSMIGEVYRTFEETFGLVAQHSSRLTWLIEESSFELSADLAALLQKNLEESPGLSDSFKAAFVKRFADSMSVQVLFQGILEKVFVDSFGMEVSFEGTLSNMFVARPELGINFEFIPEFVAQEILNGSILNGSCL